VRQRRALYHRGATPHERPTPTSPSTIKGLKARPTTAARSRIRAPEDGRAHGAIASPTCRQQRGDLSPPIFLPSIFLPLLFVLPHNSLAAPTELSQRDMEILKHLSVMKKHFTAFGVTQLWHALILFSAGLISMSGSVALGQTAGSNAPLRIICFGAHPDDCEIQAGGVAAMWAARGHKVKLVSVTNGDIGHWRDAGGPLANRRRAEVEAAAKVLGVTSEVLDIHDGELLPTLENRKLIVRLIREWKADIVMGPRPNDYHPDHRYTGVLVQDAAYMVTVPFFCPDVPHLAKNPVFLYFPDSFKKPNPFTPDIVVAIDDVIEKKLDALDKLVSQFHEGGANGGPALMPADPAGQAERAKQVREYFRNRQKNLTTRFKSAISDWYGEERAGRIEYIEAFEVCEYGRRPDRAELKRLFPFFDAAP